MTARLPAHPGRPPTASLARSSLFALALLPFLAIGLATCARPSKPSVLLITVDTLRADRLSCYGYRKHETPNIDRLASQGVLFENAFCDVTWTTPSMSSVLTGTYATVHGFKTTDMNVLAERNITIAEVLRDHGYATAAVIGSFPLDAIYQLNQGFEYYNADFTLPVLSGAGAPVEHLPSRRPDTLEERKEFNWHKLVSDSRRTDPQVTDAASAWLKQNRRLPFFLWVHYFGPHGKPDARVKGLVGLQERVIQYDPDVRLNDSEVGRLLKLLDDLELAQDTLVIFHADHGESFTEHNYFGHGTYLYEPTLHIPLIMRFPGQIPPGKRIDRLARNVDIFPTILDAVGVSVSHELSGVSLLPLACSRPGQTPNRETQEIYMETHFPATTWNAKPVTMPDGSSRKVGVIRRGIRTQRWKFIQSEPAPLVGAGPESLSNVPPAIVASLGTEELYDMSADPAELHNLVADQPEVAEELRRRLASYVDAERRASPAPVIELDEGRRELLRILGYGD